MPTRDLEEGLAAHVAFAGEEMPVIMCAEAVPWRCHRSLVTDARLARGVEVAHIMDAGVQPAWMAPFARARAGRVM